ncbi:MAG: hypothetical protein KBC84_09380, partial [Proteobacteria bacterium]|nr:hypothetical protein [Pseudomonadota bacterium]
GKQVGIVKYQLEQVLTLVKKESFLNAQRELGIEVPEKELAQLRKEKQILTRELRQSCEQFGVPYEEIEKKLTLLSESSQKKIKEAILQEVEDRRFKSSFADKVLEWGKTVYISYVKLEELLLQTVQAPLKSIAVISSEVLKGTDFSTAYHLGIEAGAEKILSLRSYYLDKYKSSYWGSDKEFAESGDFKIIVKTLPIAPMSDLAFSGLALVDIAFKEELGKLVYYSWNSTASALNYESAIIENRRDFCRWWSHGVEVAEVMGACAIITASGGAAGLGFGHKAFRIFKYLGSSGTTSYLSAVAQEWLDKDSPNDYFRALENASANMGGSAIFMAGSSGLMSLGRSAQASNALLRARAAGLTTVAVDVLDDVGDVQDALENVSTVGLGKLEEQQGAALQAAVALYSARPNGNNNQSSNTLSKEEIRALLPQIENALLPEVQAQHVEHHSRRVPCKIQIGEELVDAFRSRDGQRYYLTEPQIAEKYYYDRLAELEKDNKLKSFYEQLSQEELKLQARKEALTKAAYTDEINEVCYLPIVTAEMRESLSANELVLKQVYYKSLEIHEVAELRKLRSENYSFARNRGERILLSHRLEFETAQYALQNEFIEFASLALGLEKLGLTFSRGELSIGRADYRVDGVGSEAFQSFISSRYLQSSFAAAEIVSDPFVAMRVGFPLLSYWEQRHIVEYSLVYSLLCTMPELLREGSIQETARDRIFKLSAKIVNALDFNTPLRVLDSKYLIAELRKVLVEEGYNSKDVDEVSEDVGYVISQNLVMQFISEIRRAEYGKAFSPNIDFSAHQKDLLAAGARVIIDCGAGGYVFSRKLHQRYPDSIIVAIEPMEPVESSEVRGILRENPRLAIYRGFDHDLQDPQIAGKVSDIFLIFPSPGTFAQDPEGFILNNLAPGGECHIVTELFNPYISGQAYGSLLELVSELRRNPKLLVEIRTASSRTLPESLRSGFFEETFKNPEILMFRILSPNHVNTEFVLPEDAADFERRKRAEGYQVHNYGPVGEMDLSYIHVQDISNWRKREINFALEPHIANFLKYSAFVQDNGSIIKFSFSHNDETLIDYVFDLISETKCRLNLNRIVHPLDRDIEPDCLNTVIGVMMMNGNIQEIELELDWKRLNLRTIEQDEINNAVTKFVADFIFAKYGLPFQFAGWKLSETGMGVVVTFSRNGERAQGRPRASSAATDDTSSFGTVQIAPDSDPIEKVRKFLPTLTREKKVFLIKEAVFQSICRFGNIAFNVSQRGQTLEQEAYRLSSEIISKLNDAELDLVFQPEKIVSVALEMFRVSGTDEQVLQVLSRSM